MIFLAMKIAIPGYAGFKLPLTPIYGGHSLWITIFEN
jgi:hypothetical protein